MNTLFLQSRSDVSRRNVWTSSVLLFFCFVIRWREPEFGAIDVLVLTAGAIAAVGLPYLIQNAATDISVVSQPNQVLRVTRLFRYPIHRKTIDLSQVAWIRARCAGVELEHIFIEAGTSGFMTTELMRLPHRSGEGVALAEEWCARIAAHLGVSNRGFRGEA